MCVCVVCVCVCVCVVCVCVFVCVFVCVLFGGCAIYFLGMCTQATCTVVCSKAMIIGGGD